MQRKDLLFCIAALLCTTVFATPVAADAPAYPQTNQFLVCGDQAPTAGYDGPPLAPDDYAAAYPAYPEDAAVFSLQGAFFASGAGDGESWEQFAKNAQHTGFTTADGPDTNTLSWSSDITAIGAPSTVIANGVLYAYKGYTGFGGSADAFLYALDEYTGDELWNVSIAQPEWGSWSSPAYHNGNVYTSTGKETRKIDATDGEVVWTFVNPDNHASCNGGPAIADGLVFCSDWDGNHYYCLYEENGTLKWTFDVAGYAQGTAAYEDGLVYLTSWDYRSAKQGHVYCAYAENGTVIWHNNDIVQNCCGSASVAGDMVYVTTYNFYGYGDLLALSKETGEIVWQKTIERTDSTPAIAYGNVYVTGGCSGFSEHRTFCFNATTGEEIWVTDAADDIGGWTCSVAVADGKVYVGGESHDNFFNYDRTFALDAYTGEIVWWCPQGGATPIVHDGRVFTVGNDGLVYCFGPALLVPAVAAFSANVTSGDAPLAVQFTDASTGSPTSWAWDFENDGTVDSTEQNPVYTYETEGTYTVNLTATNAAGSSTEIKTDYITVTVPEVTPFPNPAGGTFPAPTDPNGDGLYEDLDGNGWIGFNDVVVCYDNLEAIDAGTYGPASLFDYDGNGWIGFNDVIGLFEMV